MSSLKAAADNNDDGHHDVDRHHHHHQQEEEGVNLDPEGAMAPLDDQHHQAEGDDHMDQDIMDTSGGGPAESESSLMMDEMAALAPGLAAGSSGTGGGARCATKVHLDDGLLLAPSSSHFHHRPHSQNYHGRYAVLGQENVNSSTIFRNRGFGDRLLTELAGLRSGDQLCDVVLVAGASPEECAESEAAESGDRCELRAHRVVLAACCLYFRAMFSSEMAEARLHRVYIQGVNAAALAMLIDYIYTAEIRIAEENVQLLLPASSLLQLNEVRTACCEFLKSQLDPSNCLGIRDFADLHSCDELLQAANMFTEQHFSELVNCEEFLSLNGDQFARLISSDRLTTPGEEKVFEAVMCWVRHEADRRKGDLPRLMEFVRLPLLPQDYLLDKVDGEPLIRESPVCKDFLIEALKYHLMKTEQRTEFKSPRIKPRQPVGMPKLLMVIGGQAPKAIRNVDVYDLQNEQWNTAADLPQRRCRCGVALLNGLVYAVGGFNGSLRVRTVDAYDAVRNAWLGTPSMEARRSTLGVAVMDGRLIAVGGFDGSTGLNSCEAFDPRSGEWRMIAPMSTRRSSVGVGVLNGCVFAVGGYDGQSRQCLATVEKYDSRMDRWVTMSDMTTRRSGAGVAIIGDSLLAVGGHDGPMVKRSTEVYDPIVDQWRPVADMSLCRRNAGVVTANDTVYAVGGDDGTSNLVSVEVYRPETEQWTVMANSMGIGRSYAGVAMLAKAS